MMLSFDDYMPEIEASDGEDLYLFIDGSQFDNLPKLLYSVSGSIDLEPIYLDHPYDALLEVSPYIVRLTKEFRHWFFEQNKVIAGFFFSSNKPIDELGDHFRNLIKVVSAYGSDVYFKMANSECAWVFLETDSPYYWNVMNQVWVPTRFGWKELNRTENFVKQQLVFPFKISEAHWSMLGEISWRNSLEEVREHLEKYFPQLINTQSEFDKWLDSEAKVAYRKGFVSVRDLAFYFNIIGYLGINAVNSEQFPEISQLLNQPSLETPSQRIERAAELAYDYSITTENY